jgi:hypothetical protein
LSADENEQPVEESRAPREPPKRDEPTLSPSSRVGFSPEAPDKVLPGGFDAPKPRPTSAWLAAKRYAFWAIPAIALLELLTHVVEVTRRIPPEDWLAARRDVQGAAHPEDLVVFAPRWADPLGREFFKDGLATVDREARSDDTQFPRAFVVSIRGAKLEELDGWKEERRASFGAVTVTTYSNPSPARVIDDLVAHAAPERAQVTLLEGGRETDCPWTHGSPASGGIGFGPAIPSDRFVCPRGAFVATSVLQATDYRGHKCLYASPIGGSAVLRIRFIDVEFGRVLHGHHAINWDSARFNSPPVTLVWKAQDRTFARLLDGDSDGWKGFEIDTSDLAGQKGELVAEVSASTGSHRQYCFEADTR